MEILQFSKSIASVLAGLLIGGCISQLPFFASLRAIDNGLVVALFGQVSATAGAAAIATRFSPRAPLVHGVIAAGLPVAIAVFAWWLQQPNLVMLCGPFVLVLLFTAFGAWANKENDQSDSRRRPFPADSPTKLAG